ncbi:sulfotransferase family 2 domain-containing protein [Planktotalea arctica]|uniref:sulfotransferase family 2 domain-containing protein n=1 Tax=Planktotalea arctica TaxID=1481893 RepID=UPI000A177DDF|nr:sulfotransferase family 2 domain-containing protein [Planktotalea arctica]
MTDAFDYFIVFAEMRTGSNFLEANLNALDGVTCHGEAFNPHFIGFPNKDEILGITREMREDSPEKLIETIKQFSDGLGGFRYFHDHDPRVIDIALNDLRCAKIILTRNPLESYVSWKIAQETGQWKLTNVKRRRDAKATFNAAEFEMHVEELQAFQVALLNRLQAEGQTAFYIAYEDLQSVEVMNGLARYLGVDARLDSLDDSLKPQNPVALEEKVANADDLERGLSRLDRFNLARTPNFEPRRGPVVPSYIAAAHSPLLYMPIRSGPEAQVQGWLAALDGVAPDALLSGFNQKTLRQWKRDHVGHRTFTVLRHPVARLHEAFCSKILTTNEGSFTKIRNTLRRFHKLPIPGQEPNDNWDLSAHQEAFIAFAQFVKMNLSGQTSIRVDAHWCSQTQAIANMGEFALPDMVLREDQMQDMLPSLAISAGVKTSPLPDLTPSAPLFFDLADIYNADIENAVQEAYQRDYLMFGFSSWS